MDCRDLEQNNFNYLPLDPQEHTCIPFQNNLNTRLIEDNFKPQVPCIDNGIAYVPSINSQTFGVSPLHKIVAIALEHADQQTYRRLQRFIINYNLPCIIYTDG